MQAIWVEIPAKDIERALQFYRTVFDLPSTEISNDDVRRIAVLADPAEGRPGISLNQTKNFEPGNKGVLVYLDTAKDLSDHLKRVEAAGGKVVEPKTSMGAAGYYATILDTEGNQVALYSPE